MAADRIKPEVGGAGSVAEDWSGEGPSTGASHEALRALGRILSGFAPAPALDWEPLSSLARRHGVSPLLFWRLQEAQVDAGIPAEIRDLFREDLYTAAAHGMVAERQLAQVLGALHAAGIPCIVIKGAAVAAFYPDPALRRYGDLDLWVRQEQLPQAEEVLLGLDYAYAKPKAWWLLEYQHLPPLRSKEGTVLVELHWCLDRGKRPGRLPAEALWARAVPWTVGGHPALRLDPVDTVLHLCRHAVVQHRVRLGLRSLCDLAQVTEGWTPAEWDSMARRAQAYALARPVYLMLTLVEQALGRSAPPEVISAIKPPPDAALPDDLIGSFVKLEGEAAPAVPLAVVRAGVEGTFAARLHHLLLHLFLPRDGMAAAYNVPADSPRIWLAYLWRPLDLLGRYGRSTWHMLRGQQAAQAAWAREAWLEEWLRSGQP